jgi:hypothetical protein
VEQSILSHAVNPSFNKDGYLRTAVDSSAISNRIPSNPIAEAAALIPGSLKTW